jgi:protoheme IX farnesyltransferase
MATEPILAVLDLAEVRRGQGVRFGTWSDYWALTKPEVNFLIAIATGAAFCLACPRTLAHFPWIMLLHTLLGTVLVASGAGSLNQVIERNFDAQMRRTARRPIADGRISTSYALAFGIVLSLAGSLYLALAVRPAASLLALATLAGYLLLYTPLKRLTPLCTLVGAFPGAMPVLIGYAAAIGKLNAQAWLLYAVLFFWQFPHFMAIAWMYREDYARAGYLVLPAGESSGRFMIWQTVVPALVLLPVTLSLALPGRSSFAYTMGSLLLTGIFAHFATQLATRRSRNSARRLLLASIIYLPLMFLLVILCRG